MARTEQLGIKQSKTAAAKTAETLKLLESQGFQFEGAEASFELLVRRQEPDYQPPFELLDFLTLVETRGGDAAVSEAMVKIRVGDDVFHTAAEGNGPVSALDAGTRKALLNAYPALDSVRLVDYKVRIVDSDSGTDASTRVLIDSTNGQGILDHSWEFNKCGGGLLAGALGQFRIRDHARRESGSARHVDVAP